PTAKPSSGKPYILVYQDGNLYTQLVSTSPARTTAKRKPAPAKAKPAPVSQGSNLDDIAAPAPAAQDDMGANLDEIQMPAAGSKIDTTGLKADKATEVKV